MRFIIIDGNYINIDYIISIEKTNGNFNTTIRLTNGTSIYTNETPKYVAYLIKMAEKEGKEVSR